MSYENFAYYYDSLMDDQFYEDYYNFINEHASFDSVLELGCGTGEIAIKLAKDNKYVLATDLSKDMLEVARLKAMDNDVDLLLGRIDMTDFETNQPVDLVLCLCDSINYLLKKDDVLKTFTNVYQALKNNGTFIFDVNSLYKTDQVLVDYFEEANDDDFYFKWAVTNKAPGRIEHYVEIIDKENNDHVKEIHHQQTYDLNTYINLLKQAGFENIEYYGEFEPYNDKSQRIIFVCYKKEGK